MKTRYRWVLAVVVAVALAAVGFYAAVGPRSPRGEGAPAAPQVEAWLTDEAPSEPLALVGAAPSKGELRSAVAGANVIICLLDEARSDHFGCYGYARPTTPNVDKLAPDSIVFTQHFCPIAFTRTSTTSLLTSQYPDTHSVFRRQQLSPSAFTLESALADAGWSTAFFTANVWASPACGVGEDFGFIWTNASGQAERLGPGLSDMQDAFEKPELMLQQVSQWLKTEPRQPFFAYLHFRHPHKPYDAPADMQGLFAGAEPPGLKKGEGRYPPRQTTVGAEPDDSPPWEVVNQYDANLRYADWAVGELERILREQGVFDNTLLMITSDHGVPLGERENSNRQWCVYEEAVRIPLVIKFPGESGPAGSVGALTETIDLLPTILDLFDIPYPRVRVQGQSLLDLLTGSRTAVRDYAFARTEELPRKNPANRLKSPERYLVRGLRWALILPQGDTDRELYDLKTDPGQTRNVAAEHPGQTEKMMLAFRAFAATQTRAPLDFVDPKYTPPVRPEAPSVEMTEEARKQLRALGYVE